MLIKKSTTNKHQIISNNIMLSTQLRQPSASPLPLPSPSPSSSSSSSSSSSTYSAAEATSCNTHHQRHLDCHHDFHKQHSRGHYDHWNQRRTCAVRWCSWWCLSSVMAILGVIVLPLAPHCEAVGYSYTRFRGPVSGPEHRIYLRDHDNHKRGDAAGEDVGAGEDEAAHLDYVAKPEYEFAYGVEDAQAHILHNRNEMRDGDAVKGVYSVVDPDGTLRVVKYTADDINGFQAEVIMNGISSIHGQLQPDTPTTISNLATTNQNNNGNQYPINTYPSHNNNNYKPHYYPYHYATPAPLDNPTTAAIPAYNEHNDYDDGQDINNDGDDYQPQYEVHEKSSNENVEDDNDDDNEDGEDQYKVEKDVGGGKKNDYDDDDDEQEVDEYDDSEELEDYNEAVKNNNEASEESDEYY